MICGVYMEIVSFRIILIAGTGFLIHMSLYYMQQRLRKDNDDDKGQNKDFLTMGVFFQMPYTGEYKCRVTFFYAF